MFASGWKERKIERAFTREDKGIDMVSNDKKLIAVIGATGQQGGGSRTCPPSQPPSNCRKQTYGEDVYEVRQIRGT